MSRRRKIRWQIHRITERYEDWLCERRWSPDWLFTPDQLNRGLCIVLGGHDPIEDQCGIPGHDYCVICQLKVPNGAAKERAERLRWIDEIERFRADPAYQLEPRIVDHLVQLYGSLEAARRRGRE